MKTTGSFRSAASPSSSATTACCRSLCMLPKGSKSAIASGAPRRMPRKSRRADACPPLPDFSKSCLLASRRSETAATVSKRPVSVFCTS